MKKLLVLALVLGMVSAANAALSLSANVDNTGVTVDGIIDADIYVAVGIVSGTLSPLDDTALGAAAPDMSAFAGDIMDLVTYEILTLPEGTTGGYWVMASSGATAYAEGNYLTLGAEYTGSATVTAYFYNEGTGETGVIGSVVIPEPMTLALLGLGGLFLRRRK